VTPDQPISLAVAIFFSLLSVLLPLRVAILPLCVAMCCYPTNVLVPPAAMSMTVARVVGLVLIVRCICSRSVREKFHWGWVDTTAVIYLGLLTVAQVMTVDPTSTTNKDVTAAINNKAGFFLSALVPFYAVRFLITDRERLYIFMKGFLWTSLPLTIVALYQTITGDSPYRPIMSSGLFWKEIVFQWDEIRPFLGMKMHRASAPFMQCIMFGWFFAIQVTWCTNLYWEKRRLMPWIVPWLVLPIGIIATVSAGPMMMAALSFVLAALFPIRRHWKVIFGSAAGLIVLVSLASSRSILEIVASFGLDATSSYYRVNLLDFFMGRRPSWKLPYFNPMNGHWLAGFGTIPHEFDDYHDLCIQWIFLTVVNGILGASGFYLFVAACGWCLRRARQKAASLADHWLIWSMLSILIASMLAMNLVALFAEMFFIYHMFLGLVTNTMVICGEGVGELERTVGVLAEMNGKRVLLRYRLRAGQKLAIVRPA
jgi:hypothetical protein